MLVFRIANRLRKLIVMRINALATGLFGLIIGSHLVSAGSISGKVTLEGTPKKEITIKMAADPRCAALHKAPVTTRHYVVGEGNGLANVIVYLKTGVEAKDYAVPSEKPLLDQEGCEYKPYVMGVRAKQTFAVKNSDPTLHNVHATPKVSGNKEFNFAQPTKGMVTDTSFAVEEIPVRFKCDVHPWMFAYVGVFDHPYYAVTDKNGNFTIKDVPAGTYAVEAYHVKTHRSDPGVMKEVVVDGDEKADFAVVIP